MALHLVVFVGSEVSGVSKITESARMEPCTIRLPGICNHNPETTVFCHYRMNTGGSLKPEDFQGAYGCSACHDEIDRRTRKLEIEYVRLAHAEGCFRTQAKLVKKGLLKL